MGAGAVAVACSSSSSPPPVTGGNDSGGSETSTPPEEAAAPCVKITAADPATIDGGADWACFETKCAAELTACAADCLCNNAFLTALQNIQTMGMSTATVQLTTATGSDDAGSSVGACLLSFESTCAPIVTDGGKGEAGDAPTGDAPSGDSATASDAPTEGG